MNCPDVDCAMRGECHCGCGEPTSNHQRNPRMFRRGHAPAARRALKAKWRGAVPIEAVRPLCEELIARFGGYRYAANAVGMAPRNFWTLARGNRSMVRYATYVRLLDAVDDAWLRSRHNDDRGAEDQRRQREGKAHETV